VVLVLDRSPIPPGHGVGAGIAPKFKAPVHASFDGGAPPLQVVVHPVELHTTQEMDAAQPALRIIPSELNTIVKHPELPVIKPGLTFPVNTPTNGDAVFGPL